MFFVSLTTEPSTSGTKRKRKGSLYSLLCLESCVMCLPIQRPNLEKVKVDIPQFYDGWTCIKLGSMFFF